MLIATDNSFVEGYHPGFWGEPYDYIVAAEL